MANYVALASIELSFGFPPSEPESAKRAAAGELAASIAERAALQLGIAFAASYRELVDDLVGKRLDAAWLPPLSLLRAERQVRPVLVLQRAGAGSYHGALVARRDSDMVGIRDLAGKRIGWVDADSAAGYVLTRALIAEHHRPLDAFLGPQQFLGSHRAVVEAVCNGTVDAGATFLNYGRDQRIVVSGWQEFLGDRADEVVPIAITGSIPGDVIAVREGLAKDATVALVTALREVASTPETRPLFARTFNGAEAVEPPQPDAYDLLAEQARLAGWRP